MANETHPEHPHNIKQPPVSPQGMMATAINPHPDPRASTAPSPGEMQGRIVPPVAGGGLQGKAAHPAMPNPDGSSSMPAPLTWKPEPLPSKLSARLRMIGSGDAGVCQLRDLLAAYFEGKGE